MSDFSPESLVDTVASYDSWEPKDFMTAIKGLQEVLNRKTHWKNVSHTILDGNGIGAVEAKASVDFHEAQKPDDVVTGTLVLNSSCFGHHEGVSAVASIDSRFALTLNPDEIQALGNFLIITAARMRSRG